MEIHDLIQAIEGNFRKYYQLLNRLEPQEIRNSNSPETLSMKELLTTLADIQDEVVDFRLKKILKEQTGFDYKELTLQGRKRTQEYLEGLKGIGIDISKMQKPLHQAIKEYLGEQRAQEKIRMDQTLQSAGLLSDLIATNRRILEEIQFRERLRQMRRED